MGPRSTRTKGWLALRARGSRTKLTTNSTAITCQPQSLVFLHTSILIVEINRLGCVGGNSREGTQSQSPVRIKIRRRIASNVQKVNQIDRKGTTRHLVKRELGGGNRSGVGE